MLRPLKVLTPPLAEQKKIAEILGAWDSAIDNVKKQIDCAKGQKKALMQQLLTGNTRFPRFTDEWKAIKVSNLGRCVTGNTPPKNDIDNYGDYLPWATAEDFVGKYIKNTKIHLSQKGADFSRILPKGSILVTCIASIGKNAICKMNLATNQQINSIICNDDVCNEFVYYSIVFNKHKLVRLAGITAVPIVNKTSFEDILLDIPTLPEQTAITEVLDNADGEISNLEAQLGKLKLQKKALMQQLLTGKSRVKLN